jgi:hypothetical protein
MAQNTKRGQRARVEYRLQYAVKVSTATTSTGRISKRPYILTIPGEIGRVQSDIGLREKGNFIMGVKNPTKKVLPMPNSHSALHTRRRVR